MVINQGSALELFREPSVHEILAARAALRAKPLTTSLPEAPSIRVVLTRGDDRTVHDGTFPGVLTRTLWSLVPFEPVSPGARDVSRSVWGLLNECFGDEPPRHGRWGVHAEGVSCQIDWMES